MKKLENLYKENYTDKNFERLDLFQLMDKHYRPRKVIYPGSFIHITPAFIFDHTTFIDNDKNAVKFFKDPALDEFIKRKRINPGPFTYRYYPQNYQTKISEELESHDLMISLYAGFVSQQCKHYLKVGGLLLVNNSHGDASMASIDRDYQFISALLYSNNKYRLKDDALEDYFIPKKDIRVTREYIQKTRRGIGYREIANSYIFKRIN